MFCPECGIKNENTFKYCHNCGFALSTIVPEWSKQNLSTGINEQNTSNNSSNQNSNLFDEKKYNEDCKKYIIKVMENEIKHLKDKKKLPYTSKKLKEKFDEQIELVKQFRIKNKKDINTDNDNINFIIKILENELIHLKEEQGRLASKGKLWNNFEEQINFINMFIRENHALIRYLITS